MRLGITGASGLVGHALCLRLAQDGHQVVALSRRKPSLPEGIVWRQTADLGPDTAWDDALEGLQCVVHTAAHVHQRNPALNQDGVYHRVNTEGTRRLALAACDARVRRLVFISSIKALGERTAPGRPFRHDDTPAPEDAYGRSKMAAEQTLWAVAQQRGLETVVIRPALVYGPRVRSNFEQLLRWVVRGYPLPLARVRNARSLVGLSNLVDLIAHCVDDPRAIGQTFLVSDGKDLSTPDLIRAMARAAGTQARLWPVPVGLLDWGAGLMGRTGQWQRLSDNLQVDIGHTCRTLDWSPPVTLEDELLQTVAALKSSAHETPA